MQLAKYFSDNRPKPKYEFGTRVFGHHKGIPFIGTTGADNLRSTEVGPQVTIMLDLPIKIEGIYTTVIRASYHEIKSQLRNL